jgi:hypothetical protein
MLITLQNIVWDKEDSRTDLPSEVSVNTNYPNGYILKDGDLADLMDDVSIQHECTIDSCEWVCHDSD